MNREVNLTKRVRTAAGLRFCPVVISGNGKIKPDYVLVDGREEFHREGSYYLDWYEGTKRIRKSVGRNAAVAANKRLVQERVLEAPALGTKVIDVAAQNDTSPLLVNAAATYLGEIESTKKPKTFAAYQKAMEYFQESCKKQRVAEIERADLLKFSAYLRDHKKLSPRTVYNKFENIMSFLKAQGVRGLVGKNDWPRFVEDEPEVYEPEELNKFFKACDSQERLWFEFFLMTGLREQEVMHCTWADINSNRCAVSVRYKKEYGFSPKAYKGREVPIPDKLVARLKKLKAKAGDCPLLFPTAGCKPKMDFLDTCKAIARRAKLNPNDFWLHKFRATFATRSLWKGVDLRTVQAWMGHTDMESTMRYLKPNRGAAVREKVNAVWDD